MQQPKLDRIILHTSVQTAVQDPQSILQVLGTVPDYRTKTSGTYARTSVAGFNRRRPAFGGSSNSS